MLYLIAGYLFITVLLVLYVVFTAVSLRGNIIRRLEKYNDAFMGRNQEENQKARSHNSGDFLRSLLHLVKGVGNIGLFSRYKKKVQFELVKAHIPLKGEELITISLVLALLLALITGIAAGSIAVSVLFGILGWLLPVFFVRSKIKRRVKLLNDQLGDAITLVSNSLKAGYSFFQAIDTITSEMSGSISEEFAQVKREVNLGLTTENALENLVKRVESDDLELVVTAILIQRQVGGNLAEILDNISETIRHRVRIKGEVRTITAQGRMSGIIIGVIPPIMGLMLSAVNPQYISLLFTRKIGLMMVGISVAMELLGLYFINKIVKIEV